MTGCIRGYLMILGNVPNSRKQAVSYGHSLIRLAVHRKHSSRA